MVMDADAAMEDAEELIQLWEATKAVPAFDGFVGLERICDSGRWDEAGLVRPRVPLTLPTAPAPQQPQTTGGGGVQAKLTAASHSTAPLSQRHSTTGAPAPGAAHAPSAWTHTSGAVPRLTSGDTIPDLTGAPDEDTGWLATYVMPATGTDVDGHISTPTLNTSAPTASATPTGGAPLPGGQGPAQGMLIKPPTQQATAGSRGPRAPPGAGSSVTPQALGRAVLRHALVAAKLEVHQQLDWVDDLPTAPTSKVPPKPPSNNK